MPSIANYGTQTLNYDDSVVKVQPEIERDPSNEFYGKNSPVISEGGDT